MTSTKSVIQFLLGTFMLSSIAFAAMILVPNADAPEGLPGLPIWLLAIWSPTIISLIIAQRNGQLSQVLKRATTFRGTGAAFALVLTPIMILGILVVTKGQSADYATISPQMFALLFGFNLFLGPIGEEFGWRGLLQPALKKHLGWLGGALVVGIIWALWHAPLWFFNSPQSAIPFGIFTGHVLAYSIIMAAAQRQAPHSLVPAIILHTLFNVIAAVAMLWGLADIANFYAMSLPIYAMVAILAAGLLSGKGGCPIPTSSPQAPQTSSL